ncbi:hypothetical protein [Streptomyces sp. NPDC006274]|uniref:hypothetical protein n=1 Tax=unclassified Streptomyces TaxID=2593676 RepID=UPI0033B1BEF4
MRYRITAPEARFNGESVGVSFNRGTGFVEDTDKPGRAALEYFRRHGYSVSPSPEQSLEEPVEGLVTGATTSSEGSDELFDPGEYGVEQVVEHLNGADLDEALRVLDAEAAGKDRVTITKLRDDVLAAKASGAPAAGDTT